MKTMRREDVMISSVTDVELLSDRSWTDVMIKKIDSKALAITAYEKSPCLQKEFINSGAFVGYWQALREGRAKIFQGRK